MPATCSRKTGQRFLAARHTTSQSNIQDLDPGLHEFIRSAARHYFRAKQKMEAVRKNLLLPSTEWTG